jgi:hypothetical protein
VAANVGITERAVQKIVRDMQDSGVVEVTRIGRRNHYAINGNPPLQHSLEAHRRIGQLVELIAGPGAPGLVDSVAPVPSSPPRKDPVQVAKPAEASDDSPAAAGEQRSLF